MTQNEIQKLISQKKNASQEDENSEQDPESEASATNENTLKSKIVKILFENLTIYHKILVCYDK